MATEIQESQVELHVSENLAEMEAEQDEDEGLGFTPIGQLEVCLSHRRNELTTGQRATE